MRLLIAIASLIWIASCPINASGSQLISPTDVHSIPSVGASFSPLGPAEASIVGERLNASVKAESPPCGANRHVVIEAAKRFSTHYSVPYSITMGIIWVESGCNPSIESSAGAIGLMQVMSSDQGWQFRDRPKPAELRAIDVNVMWGVWLLYEMDYRYCGKWHKTRGDTLPDKAMFSYWSCALGVYWGGTLVYYDGLLNPYQIHYANMVLGAAGRIDE